ncbi:hypothetical protein MSIMFI_04916 [Mycobacterium simulans]|uniref:hypothetical protein n=1 Tax=Mycobacterium simulans TaxID=627089 RepID=UPI00174D0F0A|nr:hypothetical protein [Mycobacterium simulans]SON63386.1 hypothetical protein MSIMFI_04916 [Mycobacterium simulans]
MRLQPVYLQRPAAPEPVYTQAQQRERRRHWMRVRYRADFSLSVEVGEILGPLAREVSTLPRPLAVRVDIDKIADATHELVSTVVGMLAESKPLDPASHARIVQAVRDLAQRPTAPEISDAEIISGQWAVVLVGYAGRLTADLAGRLGRSPSASQRLEDALRVLDTAALDLARRIPKLARYQALPTFEEVEAARKAQADADRVQRALSKITPATTTGVRR